MSQTLTAKQQYWSEILETAENSGLPLVEFARVNQLRPQELYRWLNQLKKYTESYEQPNAQFTQVVATSYSTASCSSIKFSHAQLQFNELPDADWLTRLLAHQALPV